MGGKISMGKLYQYRNGEPARVVCIDRPSEFSVISIQKNGTIRTHLIDGRYVLNDESDFDLIEVTEQAVNNWLMQRLVEGDHRRRTMDSNKGDLE